MHRKKHGNIEFATIHHFGHSLRVLKVSPKDIGGISVTTQLIPYTEKSKGEVFSHSFRI